MMPGKAVPIGAEGQALYRRLWIHETLRVFHDRLVDKPDRSWLLTQVCTQLILQVSEQLDSDSPASLPIAPHVWMLGVSWSPLASGAHDGPQPG